jgi:hypothetical protein
MTLVIPIGEIDIQAASSGAPWGEVLGASPTILAKTASTQGLQPTPGSRPNNTAAFVAGRAAASTRLPEVMHWLRAP